MSRVFLLLPLLAACGVDSVGSEGELGRLRFSLSSDAYIDETSLTDVSIVTRHAQYLGVGLTDAGDRLAGASADELRYSVEPSDGVVIEQEDPVDDDDGSAGPPSLEISVDEPGVYVLEASLHGDLFDRISLNFDAPSALELALFVREPWGEAFDRVEGEGPTQVREGAQLAWLPIATDAAGERLVGDVEAALVDDGSGMLVPAENVSHVNEDKVYDGDAASLYFVEPGEVTVTIEDAPNAVTGAHPFMVVE
jgi:hypothetical protein